MSTLSELLTHRDEAGARYVAAVTELRASFGDLAAIDRLLEHKNGTPGSFGGERPDLIPLRHPIYLSGDDGTANAALVSGSFEDDVKAAYAVRAPLYGTPDP